MFRPDRVAGNARGTCEPRDMDDWCGALLQDLDGFEGSPTDERHRALIGAGVEAGPCPEGDGRAYTAAADAFSSGEGADVLGKRARMSPRGPLGAQMRPLPDGRPPTGPRGHPAERLPHPPVAMGPYRSTSMQSIESTLSDQLDHHAVDDNGDDDGGGFERRSPPRKKGPAYLPAAAPTLQRRALSEGARAKDDELWERAASEYVGLPYGAELAEDGMERNEWSLDNDDPSASRAGSKTAPWTRTEDQVIAEAVRRFGCKWGVLSALLPGRTDNAVRNRWHRLERARKWREGTPGRRPNALPAGGEDGALIGAQQPVRPAPPADAGPRTSGGSGYKCGRCGQPKRGHLCSVTLESDQVVYEAAQDKMRELHLQQADKRHATSTRRKQPADKGDSRSAAGGFLPLQAGGGAFVQAQPLALHAQPQQPPQLALAHAHAQLALALQPMPPRDCSAEAAASSSAFAAAQLAAQPQPGGPKSAAAQRQQAQRAQAHAQRQHQLAMQAQLRAHYAAMHAQRMAAAAQSQPTQPAHAYPLGKPPTQPQQPQRQAQGQPHAQQRGPPGGTASSFASPSVSPARESAGGRGGMLTADEYGMAGGAGGSGADDGGGSCLDGLDLLSIHPGELLQLHSLLGGAEDDGAAFCTEAGTGCLGGAYCGGALESDPCYGSFAPSRFLAHDYEAAEPPSLDRALSAPAGLCLDDGVLGSGRWPQVPDTAPLRPSAAAPAPHDDAKGDESSPTATAA